MTNPLQKVLDTENIKISKENLKRFNQEIRQDSDKRLKELYEEFKKQECDYSVTYGAEQFLKFLLSQK